MTDYQRTFCARCDNYRGYVCAEHREPSYEQLRQRLAAAEAERDTLRGLVHCCPVCGESCKECSCMQDKLDAMKALLREAAGWCERTQLFEVQPWAKRVKEVVEGNDGLEGGDGSETARAKEMLG
jgi:hypothetical protein